jgi:hypothetical protein
MRFLRMLGVAAVVAIGTWFVGWWAVPLCGAVYAVLRQQQPGAVSEAAFGAMIAWTGLLIWQFSHPAFGRLSAAVSGVFPVPVPVLMLLSVGVAGVLAAAAARITHRQQ